MPAGFQYRSDFINDVEQRALLSHIPTLSFREFEFHGYLGKRRTVSFGWKYNYEAHRVEAVQAIPEFLTGLRAQAAAFANIDPETLQQALVTEYAAGVSIGWHKDKAVYGDVIGISLLSPGTFRLRRPVGGKWERASMTVEPGSIYLLRGASRTEWEHSISPVGALRYSITFRNFRTGR